MTCKPQSRLDLRCVRIAAPVFTTAAERGARKAQGMVLNETAALLRKLRGLDVNLVVFSEGVEAFGMTVDQAEAIAQPGPFLTCYAEFAAAERCCVAGSIKLREHGRVYNALAFIGPDGRVLGTYSKTFLTRGEVEQGLTPGPGAVAVDTPVGRLGGAICFDLNFTELVEQNARLRPDIIAFASMYHGGLMQGYWAYQCRANFVSALPFIGGGILDPFGRPVALTDCYTKVVMADVNLDRVMAHLDFNQEKFLAIRKKYGRDVCIDIPANIGSALITSTVPDRTAAEIAAEFELELLDDYFASSIRDNRKSRVSSVECRVSSVEWKSQ